MNILILITYRLIHSLICSEAIDSLIVISVQHDSLDTTVICRRAIYDRAKIHTLRNLNIIKLSVDNYIAKPIVCTSINYGQALAEPRNTRIRYIAIRIYIVEIASFKVWLIISACQADIALVTLLALSSSCASSTSCAGCTSCAGVTLIALVAFIALVALFALSTSSAGITLIALVALLALSTSCAGITLIALVALFALSTSCAGISLVALFALSASCATRWEFGLHAIAVPVAILANGPYFGILARCTSSTCCTSSSSCADCTVLTIFTISHSV